jgi:FtsP/CotA-like multicopper oxidase with cupredoxin domain
VQRVLELRVDDTLLAQGKLPDKLNDINYYGQADMQNAVRRNLVMYMANDENDMFSINRESMNMDVINERVKKGDMELWTITGEMMPHPFHVHGVSFQIVTHNGQSPSEADKGWKDTLMVTEESSEILMRFNHSATDEFPYMYHCHILEHEDAKMMGQFTVTD